MDYLTRWRMLVAGDKLMEFTDPISVVARSLAYESESVFSAAFKRVMGCSPRQYSPGRNQTPRSRSEEEALAPIGSHLSQVEPRGWRLLRASNPLQRCRNPAPGMAAAAVSASVPG